MRECTSSLLFLIKTVVIFRSSSIGSVRFVLNAIFKISRFLGLILLHQKSSGSSNDLSPGAGPGTT